MTQRKNIEFELNKKTMNNMKVDSYKFPYSSTKEILNSIELTEEQQSNALDKMLESRPDYLDLDESEQYALIMSTLQLETVAYWLLTSSKVKKEPSMYQASLDTNDVTTIELYYIKEDEVFKKAMAGKKSNVVPLPRKVQTKKENKETNTKILPLRKD